MDGWKFVGRVLGEERGKKVPARFRANILRAVSFSPVRDGNYCTCAALLFGLTPVVFAFATIAIPE